MSDKNTNTPDDTGLIDFFNNFDKIPPIDKLTFDWSTATDFQVYKEFLINDIKVIQSQLENAEDHDLYNICEHTFNILDWIKLMVYDAGYPTFGTYIESFLKEHFGDGQVIQNIYDSCLEKWISDKSGQQKVGENFYNILNSKIYYRNHLGLWFEVERKSAFDLRPDQEVVKNEDIINSLNKEYKETPYDVVFKQWQDKQYQGTLPDNFLQFEEQTTDPETYFNFTLDHLKILLKNPVSITELERWNGGEITDLDYMIKLSCLMLKTVERRRNDNAHTVYLLRDCLLFYEIHNVLDLLKSEKTSVDQVMIGRKLLSNGANEWGYYIATLEALYTAHMRYPENFDQFYNEYARLLDLFSSLNSGFSIVLANLAKYITPHIQTEKNKVVIFDIGFQGSIALLTKYIIDRYIKSSDSGNEIETDIKVDVGAVWSKKLYGERYEGFYFPYLNRVQLMTRNNDLYYYKAGSFQSGKLQIEMGSKENQHKAAVELIISVMVTLMAQQD